MAGFIDIEAELVSALPGLTGFEWYGSAPASADSVFGTVERTGGPCGTAVDRPTVALQVWGGTREQCAKAAASLAASVPSLPSCSRIRSASVSSYYSYPDIDGNRPRWQVVCELSTVAEK